MAEQAEEYHDSIESHVSQYAKKVVKSVFGIYTDTSNHEKSFEMADITPQTSLVNDLGYDSLDTVELSMIFEDKLYVEIPVEDIEELKTVGSWIEYIDQRMQQNKQDQD